MCSSVRRCYVFLTFNRLVFVVSKKEECIVVLHLVTGPLAKKIKNVCILLHAPHTKEKGSKIRKTFYLFLMAK